MNYEEYLLPMQRRFILTHLVAAQNMELTDTLLLALLEDGSMPMTREKLRLQLSWLAERALVDVNRPEHLSPHADVFAVSLTGNGLDAAKGYESVPGIHRLSREEARRIRNIESGYEEGDA